MLDKEIITAIDDLNENDSVPGEVKALIYANTENSDELSHCITMQKI